MRTFLFHFHVLDLAAIEDFDSNLVPCDHMLSYFHLAKRSNSKSFTELVVW